MREQLKITPNVPKAVVTDLAGNRAATAADFEFTVVDAAVLTTLSPFDGEGMVSLTREVMVDFSAPIDPSTVTDDSFFLIANGERVPGSTFERRVEPCLRFRASS